MYEVQLRMDDSTIDFILNDTHIDYVSGVPLTSVVFMLYYGFELKHFLMKISDEFLEKYPLEQHHVGSSSVYLSGSAAQGLYLNTKYLPHARDIDIVTINRKYDIRERCHYDRKSEQEKFFSVKREENRDENEHVCPSFTNANATTCHSEEKYLNIKVLPDTPTGYVLLQKCRSRPLPVQTIDDMYVSSLKTTEARAQYWHDLRPFLRQWFEKQGKDSSLFSYIEPHGPAATAYMSGFETSTPFEVDMVFCVPYPTPWPKIAEEFLYRDRPSGWPPQALISEIYNDGCTLIPKGSVGSPMEDYEWRISFTGDLKLARSLSQVQRELLHVIKAILSGAPEAHQLSGLVTSIESYQFMNLLYYESEQISKDRWRQENIAELLFHILDKYLEHFQNRHLSHYFIKARNIFEKYVYMSEEEIDTVLYTVLRIRHDPLGQLLQQQSYLRISPTLYKMTFSPFVEHVKAFGVAHHQLYVSTLVRLSKAHILEESYPSANIYARQALQFYNKMITDTLSDEDYINLMFTVAVSYHLIGSADQTLETIEKLHLVMHTKSQDQLIQILGRASYTQLLLIFARTMVVSLPKDIHRINSETVIEKIKQMYQEARDVELSNLSSYVDMINTFLHLWDIDIVNSIIQDVSSQFPEFSFLTPKHDFELGDVENTEVNTFETIYDRAEYMRSKENAENTEHQDDDGFLFDSSPLETTLETELQDNQPGPSQIGLETHFKEIDYSFLGDQDHMTSNEIALSVNTVEQSDTEVTVDIGDVEDTDPREIGGVESEIIYDRQGFLDIMDEEDVPFTTEDVNRLDADLFTEYCKIKAFKNLNLKEKAAAITDRLKKKISMEKRNGKKVSMKMLETAYDMFYPKQQHTDLKDEFHDILSNDASYLVYSKADIPLLDEQLACVFHRDDSSVMRLPAEVAFLNVMIRFFKTVGKLEEARNCLSEMESLVKSMLSGTDESVARYLVACHLEWFGESDTAREMFIKSRTKLEDTSVEEQVSRWFSQMFSIVTRLEPKNKYLDKIFDV